MWHRRQRCRSREEYAKHKAELLAYAGGRKCADCGEDTLPDCCYDFDHRNPESKFWSISYLIAIGASIEDLKREVDKCDVVCSNCHRIRTFVTRAGEVRAKISREVIQALKVGDDLYD